MSTHKTHKQVAHTNHYDHRFTRPLYSVPTAARYVGMHPNTFRYWVRSHLRANSAQGNASEIPIITMLQTTYDHHSIPFIGLVEATAMQAFRRAGLSLQGVRQAIAVLHSKGVLRYALASRKLSTDGATILFDHSQEHDDDQLRTLVVVAGGQHVFREIIQQYLERIEFNAKWPVKITLPVTHRRILQVRPNVACGDPLFINGGAPLSAVRSRALAGEPLDSIASDYEVPLEDVREALAATWPQRIAA